MKYHRLTTPAQPVWPGAAVEGQLAEEDGVGQRLGRDQAVGREGRQGDGEVVVRVETVLLVVGRKGGPHALDTVSG